MPIGVHRHAIMPTPLNILIVEDRPDDAELAVHELRRVGFEPIWERVDNEENYLAQLQLDPDIILADYRLPRFDAVRALKALRETGKDIPLIVVTGVLSDDAAVECLNLGAADYLLKDRLARLGKAVSQALKQRRLRWEKDEASRALWQAERRYRSIFENAVEGIFQTSIDGAIIEANPAIARMLGHEKPRDLMDAVQNLKYDIFEEASECMEFRRRLEAHRAVHGFETRWKRKDGSSIWVSLSARAVRNLDGRITHFENSAQDITERRRAEEQVRDQANLLNLATDAIVVRDMDEKVLYWNHAAERLYGIKAEEALGKNVTEKIYRDRAAAFAAREQLLKRGEWAGELLLVSGSERECLVSSRWTLVRDARGMPKSILVIDTDVTDRKELERQFLRSQRMESIGTLASGIAHDLNNVLTPILASTTMLRRNPSPELFERILGSIESSTKRGADIVKQVLTFARGMDGERKVIQVGPIIGDVERIAAKTFPKSITIHTTTKGSLWPVVADETQIEQVLLNLCINARDAMAYGGSIRINTRNVDLDAGMLKHYPTVKPGPFVVISVEDNGSGIPPAIIDRIFDPFFTTKQPGHGTGLGLSTMVGILKGHGGLVRVESEVGKGSCFRVYLPAAPEGKADKSPQPPGKIETGSGEMILVVDDEPSVRDITKTILEGSGYQVILSNDGVDALKTFKKHQSQIKAVMTDLMMPGMDGKALIRAIREIAPDTPVMAFSGAVSDQSGNLKFDELRREGFRTFLPKPFTAEELLKHLQLTLE